MKKPIAVLCSVAIMAFSSIALADVRINAIEVGDHAPCVVLKDVQPDASSLEQCIRTKREGIDYIVLNFFSIHCGYCVKEIPDLIQLSHEIFPTADTRMVSIDRNEQDVMKFLESPTGRDIDFPVALDSERDALRAYGIRAVPTTYILDKENKVIYKKIGMLNHDDMNQIKELVRK